MEKKKTVCHPVLLRCLDTWKTSLNVVRVEKHSFFQPHQQLSDHFTNESEQDLQTGGDKETLSLLATDSGTFHALFTILHGHRTEFRKDGGGAAVPPLSPSNELFNWDETRRVASSRGWTASQTG